MIPTVDKIHCFLTKNERDQNEKYVWLPTLPCTVRIV